MADKKVMVVTSQLFALAILESKVGLQVYFWVKLVCCCLNSYGSVLISLNFEREDHQNHQHQHWWVMDTWSWIPSKPWSLIITIKITTIVSILNLRGVVVSCRFWSNECHFQATTRGVAAESLKVWCLVALDSCSSISVFNDDEHSIDGKDLNFAGVAT